MGFSDPSSRDAVTLQIIVAAGSITLGFATGALLAWVHRYRSRAKIAGARLDRYVPDHSSASHEMAVAETMAADDAEEPPPAAPSGRERRRHPRLDFFGTQWIAPFSGGSLPEQTSFCEVRCLDISTGGFSFALPEMPSYRSIVVRFQVGGAPMYLTARIVDCRPYDRAGETNFRVGCEFTGRFASDEPREPLSCPATEPSPTLASLSTPDASLSPALQQN
jgi:hypothetical protein